MTATTKSADAPRRAALLRAAAASFAEQGYHAATVADIARRAQVATGTFYLYFPSKESCFEELVGRFYELVLHDVREARRGAGSVLGKLDRSVAAVLGCFYRERDLAVIVLQRAPGASSALAGQLATIEAQLLDLLAQDLAEAMAEGLCAQGEPSLEARLILGAMRQALVFGLEGDAAEEARRVTEVRAFLRRAVGGAVEPDGSASS